jgi:HlyD family secretion protein
MDILRASDISQIKSSIHRSVSIDRRTCSAPQGVKLMAMFLAINSLLLGCGKRVQVKAIAVSRVGVEATVTTVSSGTVKAANQASLAFGAAGRVQKIYIKTGDKVQKGMLLAEIENRDLRVGAETSQAEVRRSRDLYKNRLVSRVALDEALRLAEVAQSGMDRSMIRAPFDGLITDMNLRVGELAASAGAGVASLDDKPAIRMIDDQARLIEGEVDELDLGKLKVGQPVRVRVPAANNRKLKGKLFNTVPFVKSTKEQDRTSKIVVQLDEQDISIPVGASAEIEILIETKEKVLALPPKAIFGSGKDKFVFLVKEDRLKKAKIELGMGNYERREVLSGLAEGDKVALPAEDVEFKEDMKVQVEESKWP